ncbi:MAG: hypothetical protein V2A69_15985 [Pseudomonadota bacterium]
MALIDVPEGTVILSKMEADFVANQLFAVHDAMPKQPEPQQKVEQPKQQTQPETQKQEKPNPLRERIEERRKALQTKKSEAQPKTEEQKPTTQQPAQSVPPSPAVSAFDEAAFGERCQAHHITSENQTLLIKLLKERDGIKDLELFVKELATKFPILSRGTQYPPNVSSGNVVKTEGQPPATMADFHKRLEEKMAKL